MDEKKVREAIELIKIQIHVLEEFVNYGGIIEEKKKKHIRLHKTAIEALEKQLPKKGIKEKITNGINKGLHKFYCPICYGNGDVRNKCNVGEYCSDCGQKLDWSEKE